jgi:hypothetical protein
MTERTAQDIPAVLLKGIGPLRNYDGEAGAGTGIVHILERVQLFNYLIIVTHWFGETQLEGDQFSRVRDYVDHHIKNKI